MIRSFKEHLRKMDPEMDTILSSATEIDESRDKIVELLQSRKDHYYGPDCRTEDLERVVALNCIGTLENFMSVRNEIISGCSVLKGLLAAYDNYSETEYSYHFYADVINVMKGALAMSGIYNEEAPTFTGIDRFEVSRRRSDHLDALAMRCRTFMSRYPSGLDKEIIELREKNKERVLEVIGGSFDDWEDHSWHRRNTVRDSQHLQDMIELTEEERAAIDLAVENKVPFGITPYYVSLMDRGPSRTRDHAVRAQVIPRLGYLKRVLSKKGAKEELDFMKEGLTSPAPLITRRYPIIAIMKPYSSCAQICVYCQRNWEIREVDAEDAAVDEGSISAAVHWFAEHPMVNEVLVTGGDPVLLGDEVLGSLLGRLAELEHITRIRIGTRVPVVLPMRVTPSFLDEIEAVHDPPRREVCVVTHIEHPYEVTPDLVRAVVSIRRRGISVYNQQVFTFENSRRFETALLRDIVKRSGVDPYYTFNTKGKEETEWFRVPIARILQERKEEARLLPGLTRTDEPVFNIPALGKNHLRAWQHHDMIMISAQGERVYEFHPWEKNIVMAPTYVYKDVPIMGYLDRLDGIGEDPADYWSIWYYF
ncbi:MAG: KamA family radical SAM protein [Methanomassiliicoccales archaeon]|nr:MAG: KamA family radical SAM protein [Methanomassiliicoccales archaeon]